MQIKENIKAPRHWLLWGEFTGDQWFPRSKGQWRRNASILLANYRILLSHIYVSKLSHPWLKHVLKLNMMPSSNENIFRVTGHLCGEFTVIGEFPPQRPVTRSLDFFIYTWINCWVNNREAGDLLRYRAHYDVTLMCCLSVILVLMGKLRFEKNTSSKKKL